MSKRTQTQVLYIEYSASSHDIFVGTHFGLDWAKYEGKLLDLGPEQAKMARNESKTRKIDPKWPLGLRVLWTEGLTFPYPYSG